MPAATLHLTFVELLADADVPPTVADAIRAQIRHARLGAMLYDVPFYSNVVLMAIRYGLKRPAEVRPPWEELLSRPATSDESDDVLQRAIELVKQTGNASASMLQRRLRIGYPRAARLMDEREELGIVGRSQSGGRTREVLQGEEDSEDE